MAKRMKPPARRHHKTKFQGLDEPVVVQVDAKLKKRWESASRRLAEANAKGAAAFDVKYETMAEIVDAKPPLYLAGGFATDKAFYASEKEDARSATRNMRVAHFATAAEEVEYGVSKLDAAIKLFDARAGGKAIGHLPIAFERLRVPTKQGDRSLHDASVGDVRAATRAIEHHGQSDAPEVAAVMRVLKSPGLKTVRVRFAGGHLSLTNIGADAISELGRALAAVHVPKNAKGSGGAKGQKRRKK